MTSSHLPMEEVSVSVDKKFDFSPFLQFGDTRDSEFKRREPVVHVNNQKHEAARKKMLSFVQEVQWTKSKLSNGVSLAYLYHHKPAQLMIGLIKMEPRAVKVSQNSGPIAHKFCVLTGEVDVQIEETPVYRGNGVNSIIRIPVQTCYTITNIQNDDTYLFFKSGPNLFNSSASVTFFSSFLPPSSLSSFGEQKILSPTADMIAPVTSKLMSVHNVSGGLNPKAVDMACDSIIREGVLGVPTDTIYGLIGLAQKSTVVSRIYSIKGRSSCKPVAICLANPNEIFKWSLVTVSHKLLTTLLPGPYTLIFKRSPSLNPYLNPETNLIGIRIPDHPFIISLASRIGQPLALTSANLSDQPSCSSVNEFQQLWPQLDGIFDGGQLTGDPNKAGSTVIDLSTKGFYKIIRSGCALEKAQEILENQFNMERR